MSHLTRRALLIAFTTVGTVLAATACTSPTSPTPRPATHQTPSYGVLVGSGN